MSLTPLIRDYLKLLDTIESSIELPKVVEIFVPVLHPDDPFRDEFGFIFLSDGSIGPFYVRLGDALEGLTDTSVKGKTLDLDVMELARKIESDSLAERALGFGAFNAISQHIFKRAGFVLPGKGSLDGVAQPQEGETIGMVGYFNPVIERLSAKGIKVRVVEQMPERVEVRPGVELADGLKDIADCRIVICTASTLLNDSLDEVLVHTKNAESFQLIGPSCSGLLDVVFERRVHLCGGIEYANPDQLREALAHEKNWGFAGTKYELDAATYPGLQTLLARCGSKT